MRRSGKTTRLVDKAVQELFTKGFIYVPRNVFGVDRIPQKIKENNIIFIDLDAREGNKAQQFFRDTLMRRLDIEHSGMFDVYGDRIEVKNFI